MTIKELSKRIDLSPATISRVINGGANVRPETCKQVMDAIEKYGYIPNEAARGLKLKRSTVIGVVIPDLTNDFFTSIVNGIESYLNKLGYSIILCNYNESHALQLKYAKMLLSRSIAGLIIAPSGQCRQIHEMYEKLDIPIVFIDNHPDDVPESNYVMIDNASSSYTLCCHMLDMYGEDLLLLSTFEGSKNSENYHSTARIRLEAAIRAFTDRGLKPREGWTQISEHSTFDSGYQIIRSFLENHGVPKGILATSNNIAYGAISAIQESGLKVPDDVGVCCFDAVDKTRLVYPRITSIVQPTFQIGTIAAQLVYNKLKEVEGMKVPNQKVIVEPAFQIADSCGFKLNRHTAKGNSSQER